MSELVRLDITRRDSSYGSVITSPHTSHNQVIRKDVLIETLGGTIINIANSIPYAPLDTQAISLRQIKEYAEAIQNLTAEDIDFNTFSIQFTYSGGGYKIYNVKEIIREPKAYNERVIL